MGILDRVTEIIGEKERKARSEADIEAGYHQYKHPSLTYIATGERPPSYVPGYELRKRREQKVKAERRAKVKKLATKIGKKAVKAIKSSGRSSSNPGSPPRPRGAMSYSQPSGWQDYKDSFTNPFYRKPTKGGKK